jgi:hypothetical protein
VFLKVDTEIASKRKLPQKQQELEILEAERLAKIQQNNNGYISESLLMSDEKILEELSNGYYLLIRIEKEAVVFSDCLTLAENNTSANIIQISTSRCMRPVLAELFSNLKPYLDNVKSITNVATFIV